MWIFPAVELVEDILDNWKSAGNIDGTVHSYTRFRERLQPELFRPGENKVILPDKNLGVLAGKKDSRRLSHAHCLQKDCQTA